MNAKFGKDNSKFGINRINAFVASASDSARGAMFRYMMAHPANNLRLMAHIATKRESN